MVFEKMGKPYVAEVNDSIFVLDAGLEVIQKNEQLGWMLSPTWIIYLKQGLHCGCFLDSMVTRMPYWALAHLLAEESPLVFDRVDH